MGIFGGVLGGIGKAAEGIGRAVNVNLKTVRGDKAEREKYEHVERITSTEHASDEQLAVLAQYQAEFVAHTSRNWVDSVVDAINRLPRPLLTLGIVGFFCWSFVDPGQFLDTVAVLEVIPDQLWTLFMLVVGFFFGGRVIASDLRAKPKLTEDQQQKALELIRKRAEAAEAEKKKAKPDPTIVIVTPPTEPVRPPDELPPLPDPNVTDNAVDRMIELLLIREGGWVNRVEDKGGATNHGITIATLAAWRMQPVTVSDVRSLTVEEAKDIYISEYYLSPSIDTLPIGIQSHVLDIAVNSGPRTSVKMLQKTLCSLGEKVAVDGIIGPETRDACRRYEHGQINTALAKERIRFYENIVAANPSQAVFLKGWKKRAGEFMVVA